MFVVSVRRMNAQRIMKRRFLDCIKQHNENFTNRLIQQRCCYYHELSYETTGDPCQVLQYSQIDQKEDEELFLQFKKRMEESSSFESYIGVKMLYAPVNPADINAIQGVYPSPFKSTAHTRILSNTLYNNISFHNPNSTVSGSEGIGVVTHNHHHTNGNSKQRFEEGDIVALTTPSVGTWRSFLITTESSLTKLNHLERTTNIDDNKQLQNLAPLPQIGGTAYRMLHDFVKDLSPKDVIIQNGGASSVGIMVSQLANALFKTKVVSIVRRGPDRTDDQWKQLCQYLKNEGKCAYVVQEERLLHDDTKKQAMKELQEVLYELSGSKEGGGEKILPRLGLNCIGGPSASIVARCLSHHGTMVTYGGMSKQGIVVPTGNMIFKDLKFVGYWHSRWNIQADVKTKQTMIDKLFKLANDQLIHCPPTYSLPLHDYNEGLQYAIHGQSLSKDNNYMKRKLVFNCSK